MQLTLKTCGVRSWLGSDAEPLARHANNRKIWINLRDAFPHPYTPRDARDFIRSVAHRTPETLFAITVDDEPVGGIGFVLHQDVERVSATLTFDVAAQQATVEAEHTKGTGADRQRHADIVKMLPMCIGRG